ncbi:MAG: hypothetical protein ABSD62_05650 [Candidatus Limnocylindrales bacterium]
MRALATDGETIFGDKHLAGTSQYEFVAYDIATETTRNLGKAADAAVVSGNRVVWVVSSIEDSPLASGCQGAPCCGDSVVHWQMLTMASTAAQGVVIAKGDSYRPGLGECAEAMPPLLAFDGESVVYTDGFGAGPTGAGDTITIIDVRSGKKIRAIGTTAEVDAISLSGDSLAFLQEVSDRDFNDDELMLVGAAGKATVMEEHASWFAMQDGRAAWIPSNTTSGTAWTKHPLQSPSTRLPDPFQAVPSDNIPLQWDSLVAVSADAVAWSWPSEPPSVAYWHEGQNVCLVPTPGVPDVGLVYPVAIDKQWLIWMDGLGLRPEEWQDTDDPTTYAVPISALTC